MSSPQKYDTSLFIFTRDLRVNDNLPLIQALKESKKVIPIFIFTPQQTKNNDRFSNNCFQFMIESIAELKEKIPLQLFYGDTKTVVKKLINEDDNIDAIYISEANSNSTNPTFKV